MSLSVNPLTGFRDFAPKQFYLLNHIFRIWRQSALSFGFSEYITSPFELQELYNQKSGDQLNQQIYAFTDKNNRAIAVRPELTPSLVRLLNKYYHDYRKPLRWFSIPQLFRYERPQVGRSREHFQLNCDIIGCENSVVACGEILALTIHILSELDLQQREVAIKISDRNIWDTFAKEYGYSAQQQLHLLNTIDKVNKVPSLCDTLPIPVKDIIKTKPCTAILTQLLQHLTHLGLNQWVTIDHTVVRGLDYYTDLVFEGYYTNKNNRAIFGGGNYNNLSNIMYGNNVQMTGFGMGDTLLLAILANRDIKFYNKDTIDYYIVVQDVNTDIMLMLVKLLRQNNKRVLYSLCERNQKREFDYIKTWDCHFFVSITKETLIIKNMYKTTNNVTIYPYHIDNNRFIIDNNFLQND